MNARHLGSAAGAGAGEPDRGDVFDAIEDLGSPARPAHVAYAEIRHVTGIEPGRSVCGYSLGLHQGGEHGSDLPNLYWEELHDAMSTVSLLDEVTRHGSTGVCRECALYAVNRLQRGNPGLLPSWAAEDTLTAALDAAWEPFTLD